MLSWQVGLNKDCEHVVIVLRIAELSGGVF